jgi:VanZ family protein
MSVLRKVNLTKAVLAGGFSGLVLGLFLKAMEQLTSLKVYTLLLNVDYIPLLNQVNLSEFVEFVLHLIISLILAIAVAIYLQLKDWPRRRRLYFVMIIGLLVGILLYPTTTLSERTPEISNILALLVWLAGHVIYGWVLGMMLSSAGGKGV